MNATMRPNIVPQLLGKDQRPLCTSIHFKEVKADSMDRFMYVYANSIALHKLLLTLLSFAEWRVEDQNKCSLRTRERSSS